MKSVKIILAVAVLAIMVFFVLKWFVNISGPKKPPAPTNQYTSRIEAEIDSLKKTPNNVFCQNFYEDIQYHISDNHEHGFLGKSKTDNDQWKEILSKNLYSAYAPKFAEQAMYVFTRSEWKTADLNFIRSEEKTLQSSSYLEPVSPVASSFKTIRDILAKYDEITDFISNCNNFSYSSTGLDDLYPDVSDKTVKSRTYLVNNLYNSYVNNCTRLKDGLKEIPKKLFDKHISYLSNKIGDNGDRYTEFGYQSDYSKIIYTPLRNQINALDNDTYGIDEIDFNASYNYLDNLLTKYNRNAFNHFNP